MKIYEKPDFLVVGAAKSGTTSLFKYLNHHPDVFVPQVKECRFFSQLTEKFNGLGAEYFSNSGIVNESEYFDLFKEHEGEICGDISNDYLYYYERSISNIKKYLHSDIKIVIILRNPIDRAYSNYMHHIRDGWEDVSFEEALKREEERVENNWGWSYHYIKTGMYYKQVKAYMKNFKNVKVYLFEDLKDKNELLTDIYTFLGVKSEINVFDEREYNKSGYPKNKFLHHLLNQDNLTKKILKPIVKVFLSQDTVRTIVSNIKNKNLEKRAMSKKTRGKLKEVFKKDVDKLSKLIDRDLTRWLN